MSIVMLSRSTLILPIAAALALTACGGDSADSSSNVGTVVISEEQLTNNSDADVTSDEQVTAVADADDIGDEQVTTDADADDIGDEQLTTDTASGNTGEQIVAETDTDSEDTNVTDNENSSTDDEAENNIVSVDANVPGGTPTIDGNNLVFGNDPLRMTLDSTGGEISDAVISPVISNDGRFIFFGTFAPNVVANDIGEFSDVFLRDTLNGAVTQISIGADGSQGNGHSRVFDMSADGRFLLFGSFAQNLIDAGARGGSQIYLHDTQTATTTLVSAGTDGRGGLLGAGSGHISADGETIVYKSSTRFLRDPNTISIYSRSTGETRNINLSQVLQTTELLGADIHALTPDGRFILLSCCVDFVNDEDVSVYIYDTTNDEVELLPGGGDSRNEPTISDDGQIVVYGESRLLNRRDGSVRELDLDFFRTLSPDGRWLPYTDLDADLFFLRDNLNDVDYVTNRRINGFTGDGNKAYQLTARSDLSVTDTNSRFDVYLYDFPLSDLP